MRGDNLVALQQRGVEVRTSEESFTSESGIRRGGAVLALIELAIREVIAVAAVKAVASRNHLSLFSCIDFTIKVDTTPTTGDIRKWDSTHATGTAERIRRSGGGDDAVEHRGRRVLPVPE